MTLVFCLKDRTDVLSFITSLLIKLNIVWFWKQPQLALPHPSSLTLRPWWFCGVCRGVGFTGPDDYHTWNGSVSAYRARTMIYFLVRCVFSIWRRGKKGALPSLPLPPTTTTTTPPCRDRVTGKTSPGNQIQCIARTRLFCSHISLQEWTLPCRVIINGPKLQEL